MKVKKAYTELFELLNNNRDKTVETIWAEIESLCSGSERAEKTFFKNDDNQIVSIYCYYHKRWEDISDHAYGRKVNSTTGYNTMCKIGVNQWTKQQRLAKLAKEELLSRVSQGLVDVTEIPAEQARIEDERKNIYYSDEYNKLPVSDLN